jgi:tetratricopeptide (TPR) repeat protein
MRLLLVLLPALFLVSNVRALSDADQKTVDQGFDYLYRCDYGAAEKTFLDALDERPHDPAMSLGYAIATWWRMENEFGPAGSPEEQRFLAAVKNAIDDAQHAVDKKDDAEAYVCLGAAYGLRGRLEAARKHWLRAYRDGRKSYKNEQRALELDPTLADAYLGLGAFDYYASRLSHFIQHFIFVKNPDKEQGLAELEKATHGKFSPVAAKLLLVGIDWTFEK